VWSPTTGLTPVQPAPNVIADPAVTTTYQLIAMGPQGCMDTLEVTVVRVIPIELSIEQDSIVTCDSTVVLMATSNVPNVVWVDANGVVLGNNPITVVAGALTYYTAIATDTSGCVDSLVVSVTGRGVDVSVDPNAMFMGCEQEPIQLGLINNHPDDVLTYLWEVTAPLTISNNTTANPTVSGPAGSYNVTVTVTNQYGCTQTLIIPVLVKPSQILDGDITMNLCEGLKVSFFNGSNINGVWNFGDNTSSIEANPMHVYAAAGTYLVTFTPINATCVAPWDSLIQVQADTLDRPVIAHNYVVCIDSAQIQFNGTSNNPNVTWAWTFSTGTPATSNVQNPLVTFTAEGPLTATLKVTDVNGCMEDTTVQIQVQFVQDSIVEALTVCPDEFVSLNANGVDSTASYVWTAVPPDPTLVATDKNPSVSPDVVTVYTVNISEASGCSVTYQVTVTPLQGATVTLQNDTTVCNALPLSITATGSGVVYDWSNSITFDTIFASGNIVSITPVRNGIYFVRATSVDGCTAIDSIKINNAGVAAAAGPFDGNICAGEETGLLVNNLIPGDTLTYVWTPTLPGISNPVVSPSEQTNYQVIVTNQFGCKDTLGFQVNVTTIAVDATINGPDGESTNLLATPSGNGVVISYTWTPATGLSDPNIPNPVASPESDQVYVVTVMTEDSCTASDEVLVRFVPNQCDDETVFVPNTFTPNNDSNNDYFIVRAVNITELLFIVWNRWGEKVYQTTDLNAQGWDGSFKGKEATPDAYGWFVRIRCGDGTIYEKKGDVTLLK
jgi:gliding motility-associated-like protein